MADYGEDFQLFMEENGLQTFEDYERIFTTGRRGGASRAGLPGSPSLGGGAHGNLDSPSTVHGPPSVPTHLRGRSSVHQTQYPGYAQVEQHPRYDRTQQLRHPPVNQLNTSFGVPQEIPGDLNNVGINPQAVYPRSPSFGVGFDVHPQFPRANITRQEQLDFNPFPGHVQQNMGQNLHGAATPQAFRNPQSVFNHNMSRQNNSQTLHGAATPQAFRNPQSVFNHNMSRQNNNQTLHGATTPQAFRNPQSVFNHNMSRQNNSQTLHGATTPQAFRNPQSVFNHNMSRQNNSQTLHGAATPQAFRRPQPVFNPNMSPLHPSLDVPFGGQHGHQLGNNQFAAPSADNTYYGTFPVAEELFGTPTYNTPARSSYQIHTPTHDNNLFSTGENFNTGSQAPLNASQGQPESFNTYQELEDDFLHTGQNNTFSLQSHNAGPADDQDGEFVDDDENPLQPANEEEIETPARNSRRVKRAHPRRTKRAKPLPEASAAPKQPLIPRRAARNLRFSSLQAAQRARVNSAWNFKEDDTLPKSDVERQGLVLRIINAIKDVSKLEDKDGSILRARWVDTTVVPAQNQDFYDDAAIEKAAWDTVDFLERFHHLGPSMLSSIDDKFLTDVSMTRECSFIERFTVVEELLRAFKSRCDKLLKGGVVEVFGGTPGTSLSNARGNRIANDARQGYIDAVKAVEGSRKRGRKRKRPVEDEGDEEDE